MNNEFMGDIVDSDFEVSNDTNGLEIEQENKGDRVEWDEGAGYVGQGASMESPSLDNNVDGHEVLGDGENIEEWKENGERTVELGFEEVAEDVEEKVREKGKTSLFLKRMGMGLAVGLVAIALTGCAEKKTESKRNERIVNLDDQGVVSEAVYDMRGSLGAASGAISKNFVDLDDPMTLSREIYDPSKPDYTDYLKRGDRRWYFGKDSSALNTHIGKGEKVEWDAFGTSVHDLYGKENETKGEVLSVCSDMPEALASHVSFFPRVYEGLSEFDGVGKGDYTKIDEILSKNPELREKVFRKYEEEIIRNPNTKFVFEYKNLNNYSIDRISFNDENEDEEVEPVEADLYQGGIERPNNRPCVTIINGDNSMTLDYYERLAPIRLGRVKATGGKATTARTGEKIAVKDPENQKRIVGNFENSGDAEGHVARSEGAGNGVTSEHENMSGTPTSETTASEAREQTKANEKERQKPMSDDEFEKYMSQF